MKKTLLLLSLILSSIYSQAQGPAVTSWLQNITGIQGRHYVQGNATPITDNIDANVQTVQYSNDWVYVSTHGIPAYITGPFLDGNPSLASDQNAIYKISRNPVENTGVKTSTSGGNIGIFINGVSLFDWRDGVAWNPNTNALCGGPGNPPCPGGPTATLDWNRDAIPAEMDGFDCSKAHPAMGNYHHHQNPSAFNLDLLVVSNICDMYPADGLYVLDSTAHSPLIGYAYDGFPIYGAYGYKNTDGTGGIVRMKSSYSLSTATTRANGPAVNTTYPAGYWKEDYVYNVNTDPDYLDEHNGRICKTPEYPDGIYCYFATVDENWNSAYPYVVGLTYYGTVTGEKVTSISEPTTTYTQWPTAIDDNFTASAIKAYPNPANDYIAIQLGNIAKENYTITLFDITGKKLQESAINQGSTLGYFDVRSSYSGVYTLTISNGKSSITKKIVLNK